MGYHIILVLSACLFLARPAYGQGQFAKSLTLGTSYTYIWNRTELAPNFRPITYREFIWNTNIALEVFPKWHLGFMYLHVNTISEVNTIRRQQHNIFGLFSQYDLYTTEDNWRVFAEVQYAYGDFCTCGNLDPYREQDIHYLGLGLGGEVPISKRWWLDLAAYSSLILNDIPSKYNFTQYVVGINYKLIAK